MKYKKLTENQVIISLDRLTRFKFVEDRYLRVFKDIIISNLIEPKFKKTELETFSAEKIRDIATEIFNSSFETTKLNDTNINEKIKNYENDIFFNNEEENILLNNCLDYVSAIQYLKHPMTPNLLWLSTLSNNEVSKQNRIDNNLLYPLSAILLVEGITEEILLPLFSNILEFSFTKYGIKIIAAGGKNQVVKSYYSLSEKLKVPIYVLLDNDASEQEIEIKQKLRGKDKIYLLKSGEFEDILPKKLIVKSINSYLKNFASISEDELNKEQSMVKTLEEIFKEKGLHEFKKSEFANIIAKEIKTKSDISNEIRNIINELQIISGNT